MSEIKLHQVDYVRTAQGYQEEHSEPLPLKGIQEFEPVDYEELLKRYREGNDTYDIKKGPNGKRVEVVVFNAGKLSVARIVKKTTSFSGALKNPANVQETALAAALNPGAAYIQVTSYGNYPSSRMDRGDLLHVSRTGRHTKGFGTEEDPYMPLPSMEDMAAIIDEPELSPESPTYIIADEEADRPALGLMAAMRPNSVKGVYLNGPDGISPTDQYVMAQFSDDLRSRIYRRGLKDDDPGLLTPASIKELKRNMPNIYHGIGRALHIAPIPMVLLPDVRNKLHLLRGYRGHNDLDNPDDHAVLQDMQAALRQQEAVITMQFNTESVFSNLQDTRKFGQMTMDALPEEMKDGKRKLRLLIGEGNHNAHTDNPYSRTRVERYALPDILQKMVALAGGYAIDRYMLDIAAEKAA
jgi:hypothetical protein